MAAKIIKSGSEYDVIIIGSGPAGIFTALELAGDNLKNILILERGRDINQRYCPIEKGDSFCHHCQPCSLLCGWGGAGAYSDGKLVLSKKIGGRLEGYVEKKALTELVKYVDRIYLDLGAPGKVYGNNREETEKWRLKAKKIGLELIQTSIRHMGTELSREILTKIKDKLRGKVKIKLEIEAARLLVKKGKIAGVSTKKGKRFFSKFVVVAPGRSGIGWLTQEARRFNLPLSQNPVDVGVRVELPASVLANIVSATYEPKLIYYSKVFNDRVRTFCMNPNGEVVPEFTPLEKVHPVTNSFVTGQADFDPVRDRQVSERSSLTGFTEGILTVNGHSFSRKKTAYTNFAILVSTTFTQPFNDSIAYGQYLAGLANLLSGGILVQRLGDLKAGRRSTRLRIERNGFPPSLSMATPGDLSFVLPYRYLVNLLEMLQVLNKLCPGVDSPHTLLYGVEVKFYSSQWKLSRNFESRIENLFVIGDGAGITRGLMQASISGVIVAREIKKRLM